MHFSDQILDYYKSLIPPKNLPREVEVMNPYQNSSAFKMASLFYQKYYADEEIRVICFGINPGRFGGGVTGIPFTDPIQLENSCNISNEFDKKPELSSGFIYEMIHAYGGPESYYRRFYISAVSPLGYIKDGVNLNYYDIQGYKDIFEEYVVAEIKKQLKINISDKLAFSIGKGKNIKYLNYLNDKYGFFDKIIPLSHPRWIMQYRRKRKEEFINEYLEAFKQIS